jgi:hypothetical protein
LLYGTLVSVSTRLMFVAMSIQLWLPSSYKSLP